MRWAVGLASLLAVVTACAATRTVRGEAARDVDVVFPGECKSVPAESAPPGVLGCVSDDVVAPRFFYPTDCHQSLGAMTCYCEVELSHPWHCETPD